MAGKSLKATSTTGIGCNVGERPFTADELCRILKTCRQCGVAKLEFAGGIRIEFQHSACLSKNNMQHESINPKAASLPDRAASSANISDIATLAESSESLDSQTRFEREVAQDQDDAQLMLEDPEGYEQRQIDRLSGFLED